MGCVSGFIFFSLADDTSTWHILGKKKMQHNGVRNQKQVLVF